MWCGSSTLTCLWAPALPHDGCLPACPTAWVRPQESDNVTQRGKLTPEQKKRRVVLKRVNADRQGIRCGRVCMRSGGG